MHGSLSDGSAAATNGSTEYNDTSRWNLSGRGTRVPHKVRERDDCLVPAEVLDQDPAMHDQKITVLATGHKVAGRGKKDHHSRAGGNPEDVNQRVFIS